MFSRSNGIARRDSASSTSSSDSDANGQRGNIGAGRGEPGRASSSSSVPSAEPPSRAPMRAAPSALGLPFDRPADEEGGRTSDTARVNRPQPVDGGPDKAAIAALIRDGKYAEARMLLARSQQPTESDEQGAAERTQQPESGGGATGPHPDSGPGESIPLVLPSWAMGNKALVINAAQQLLAEGNGSAAFKLLKAAGLSAKDIVESSDKPPEAPPSRHKRKDRKGPLGRVKLVINPAFDQQGHGGVQAAPGTGNQQGIAPLAGADTDPSAVVRRRSEAGRPVQSSGGDGQGPVQQSGSSDQQGPAQQPHGPADDRGTGTRDATGGAGDTTAPSGTGGLSGAGGSGGPDRPGGPSGPSDAAPLSSARLRARQDALYGPENFRFLIRDSATRDRIYLFESANGHTGYLHQSSHGPQIGPVSDMVRYISFGSREEANEFMQQAAGRSMSAILARGSALGHVGMTPPPPAGSVVVTFEFSSPAPNALLVDSSALPGEVAPDAVREQVRGLVKGLYDAMRRKLDRNGQ